MSIPPEDACSVLLQAKASEIDDRLFYRWALADTLGIYGKGFEQFKKDITPQPRRSAKSILKEVDGYIEMFNQGFERVALPGQGE